MILLIIYPLEILLNSAVNFVSLMLTMYEYKPFIGIVIVLTVVASIYTVTKWNDVGGNGAWTIGATQGNPVIHCKGMPESTRPTTYGALVFEIVKAVAPIFTCERVRQPAPFGIVPSMFSFGFVWIVPIPLLARKNTFVASFLVAFPADSLQFIFGLLIAPSLTFSVYLFRVFVGVAIIAFFSFFWIVYSPLFYRRAMTHLAFITQPVCLRFVPTKKYRCLWKIRLAHIAALIRERLIDHSAFITLNSMMRLAIAGIRRLVGLQSLANAVIIPLESR